MQNSINRLLDQYEAGRITRRQVLAGIGSLVALASGSGAIAQKSGASSNAQESTFQALEVDHVALRVTDVPRSRDFYIKHLGLKASRDSERSSFLHCGDNFLALFHGDEPKLDHYCFRIKNYDVDEAEEKIKAAGLGQGMHREGHRIYFKDPDGFEVQVQG